RDGRRPPLAFPPWPSQARDVETKTRIPNLKQQDLWLECPRDARESRLLREPVTCRLSFYLDVKPNILCCHSFAVRTAWSGQAARYAHSPRAVQELRGSGRAHRRTEHTQSRSQRTESRPEGRSSNPVPPASTAAQHHQDPRAEE